MYSKLSYNSPPIAQNDKPIIGFITSLLIYLLLLDVLLFSLPLGRLFSEHSLYTDLKILGTNELALRPTFQL